jgi:hypothetical protein
MRKWLVRLIARVGFGEITRYCANGAASSPQRSPHPHRTLQAPASASELGDDAPDAGRRCIDNGSAAIE